MVQPSTRREILRTLVVVAVLSGGWGRVTALEPAVEIYPGTNIQAVVDAYPPGTRFF